MNEEAKQLQRSTNVKNEQLILLKLADILEMEKMISPEERNYAFSLLKTLGES